MIEIHIILGIVAVAGYFYTKRTGERIMANMFNSIPPKHIRDRGKDEY